MKKIIFCLLTFIASFAVFSGDYSALKFRFTEDIETFQGEVPEEYEKLTLYENLEKIELLAEKEVVIDGSQIQKITIEENNFIPGFYNILIEFTEEGSALFGYITNENKGRKLLCQAGNMVLFNAVIMDAITSGSVTVSGIYNLSVFYFLVNNFQVECRIDPGIFTVEFSEVMEIKDMSSVNRKNPQKVAEAFIYYYINGNPEWKNFVYSDDSLSLYSEIVSRNEEMLEKYAVLGEYKAYVEKMPEKIKKPSSIAFRNQNVLPAKILVKFEKEDNIFITELHLVVNKKGLYYVTSF